MPLGFEILLEDDALLAVAKPAGIATQAPPGIDSLESRIKRYLAARGQDARRRSIWAFRTGSIGRSPARSCLPRRVARPGSFRDSSNAAA